MSTIPAGEKDDSRSLSDGALCLDRSPERHFPTATLGRADADSGGQGSKTVRLAGFPSGDLSPTGKELGNGLSGIGHAYTSFLLLRKGSNLTPRVKRFPLGECRFFVTESHFLTTENPSKIKHLRQMPKSVIKSRGCGPSRYK